MKYIINLIKSIYQSIDKYYKRNYNEIVDKYLDSQIDDYIESKYHNHR